MSVLDLKVVAAEPVGADNLVAWLSFASSAITALAWPLTVIVLALLMRKHVPHLLAVLKRLKGPGFEAEFERKVDALDAAVQASAGGAPIDDAAGTTPESQNAQEDAPQPENAGSKTVLPAAPPAPPAHTPPIQQSEEEQPQAAVPLSMPTDGSGVARLRFLGSLKKLLHDSERQLAEAGQLAASAPRATVLMAWIEVDRALRTAANAVGIPSQGPTNRLIDMLQSENVISPLTAIACHDLRELRNKASHDHDFHPDEDSIKKFVNVAESVISQLYSGLIPRIPRSSSNRPPES